MGTRRDLPDLAPLTSTSSGCSALDDEHWKRDLDEVATVDGARLGPAQAGPAGDEDDGAKPLIFECGGLVELLELLLAERVHLDMGLA